MTNVNPDFKSWMKTPRLDSPFLITEKIDGTNGCVLIEEILEGEEYGVGWVSLRSDPATGKIYKLAAQSRNRLIDLRNDNYGFAKWVYDHAVQLITILGPGRHYGEWWGGGLQRGYGLAKNDKRFSLFNVKRHNPFDTYLELRGMQDIGITPWADVLPSLSIVPVLDFKEVDCDLLSVSFAANDALDYLRKYGSRAVQGFMKPEGIVLFHSRSEQVFKKYIDPDEKQAEIRRR